MTLYQELAAEVAGLIESGVLRPGEKIPSVRATCARRGLSQSTVLQAYHHLEDRGLIEARPRSGYVVSGWGRGLPREPATAGAPRASTQVEVADLVFELLEAGRDLRLVRLGSAFPSPLLFPLPRLAQLSGQLARKLDPWATVTDLPPGSWELRRQIARRYLLAGVQVAPEDIVITSGAMEALNLCLQAVTEPGDTVAVESPAFYGALQALQRRGLRALEVPAQPRDGVDLDALERLLDQHPVKACWFMTSFQNPMGGSVPDQGKRRLVAMLAARGIPLIEDDVYAGEPPRPAKAYDRDGLVLHCGSFAKCLAPGYRIGWAAPGRYARQLTRLKFSASISSNVLAQEVLARYLGEGGYEHHLRRLRHALQAQQNQMLRAVGEYFPPGTRVSRPRGGYFLWAELPPQVDTLELHRRALEHGIGSAPGPMFSARGPAGFGNCLRLNYGHPWSDEIETAVRTLGQLATEQA